MPRPVFFSLHFENDFYRTQQVRDLDILQGQELAPLKRWEEIRRVGRISVENWIDTNLFDKSCVIVLVGSETASRRFITYEITKGWKLKKGVLGIRINGLLDENSQPSEAGENPLDNASISNIGGKLSNVAKLKDPEGSNSDEILDDIRNNIENWIQEAIDIRSSHP